ncbi:MAG: ADP-dependent NAD(P)H-hydrate dehydratase / NAD(P)H-hydrate epimerase [Solirubrobacteraceae bacterium]|jgi:NAD(P)H-hydrate epimerase|nr:ADP-dependent NAD(P)H-hydrate dehydratase / NAD(P)H-hydrate epimerase [Solirubrobacteraceae bacterium]
MTLPYWLDPLPDAAEQRALDAWAIRELGIPGLDLMERAGTGLAELVAERASAGSVAVVCGKGNNGGDGLVAARVLREQGREVDVLLLAGPDEYQGDARANLERLPGSPPRPFDPEALAGAAAIVDAILGTGFSGEPREPAAGAIEAINGAREEAVVVACDVPSGVDASTGVVVGVAVRAHATATFHAAKPGLWISPGKYHAGMIRVINIGIPSGGPVEPRIGLMRSQVTDGIPRRGADSTKFAAGSVLVCGGSPGLTGAPCMASEAAMRAGAGYVTACVPGSLQAIFEGRLLEVMTVGLRDSAGALHPTAVGEAVERAARVDAVVLGPGLGRDPGAVRFARGLASALERPLLLDADGLNAHAGELEALADRGAPTILTPHAGELGRLLGIESQAVQARRLENARRAAAEARAVVVLKGDDTLVAQPDGRVAVSPGGAPALATAGTGDVLSGVIGAFLAKRMNPFHAACAGVFVHVTAGRHAAATIGPEGVIASDVIGALPRAIR